MVQQLPPATLAHPDRRPVGPATRGQGVERQQHDVRRQAPPDHVLGAYFHQCAIAMSVEQLARAGRFLAGFQRLIAPERVRRINALMLTCGHYDGSGEFAFRVGLPGKSGVGGGILAIAPGHASIAVWSPGLNAQGNSQLGTEALDLLARRTGWSIFG